MAGVGGAAAVEAGVRDRRRLARPRAQPVRVGDLVRGEGTFEEAIQRYRASPERAALGLDPSEYLVDRDVRVVEQVY